jgi:hypothetical protein
VAYVYQHIRKDTNHPFYIGIGSDLNFYRANKFSERNEIWERIKNKTEILVEILHNNIEWGEACKIEIELIKKYGRINNKTGFLSNMTDGGEGTLNKVINENTKYLLGNGNRGKKRTEESKLKQSEVTKGIKKSKSHSEKIRKYRIGKKMSEETKRKISENSKGRSSWNKGIKFSEESKVKMSNSKKGKKTSSDNPNSKIVLNTENGIYYNTLKEAALSINMGYSNFKRKIKINKINFKYV